MTVCIMASYIRSFLHTTFSWAWSSTPVRALVNGSLYLVRRVPVPGSVGKVIIRHGKVIISAVITVAGPVSEYLENIVTVVGIASYLFEKVKDALRPPIATPWELLGNLMI